MSLRPRVLLPVAGVLALTGLALGFFVTRASGFRKTGEESARVWFYNQKTKRLYAARRETVPPEGNGVRAIVVTFEGEETEPSKSKIAYLEKYSPELKNLLERIKAAHDTQRPLKEPIPPRDSPFFQDNSLVRRVGETEWHPTCSPEGKRIMSEWRSWAGPQGQRPIVIVP